MGIFEAASWLMRILASGNAEICIMNEPEPDFSIGQQVKVILNDRNRTPHEGSVREVIWHHKDQLFNFYLEECGRKISKRYFAEDLQAIE